MTSNQEKNIAVKIIDSTGEKPQVGFLVTSTQRAQICESGYRTLQSLPLKKEPGDKFRLKGKN